MRGSRIASLGRSTLGCSSLGIYGESLSRAVGSLPPAPSKPTAESILAKMQAEQPQLVDSLALWYDSRLQGLTNEYIQEQAIEEGMFLLKNLQGDSLYDLPVTGMSGTEDDGCVDDEGRLVFDGVDDVVIGKRTLADVANYSFYVGTNNLQEASYNIVSFSTSNTIRLRTTANPLRLRYQSLQQAETIIIYSDKEQSDKVLEHLDFEAYYPSDYILVNGSKTDIERLGSLNTLLGSSRIAYSSVTARTPMTLRHYIMFVRDLNEQEQQWVRDNMINY